MPYEVTAARKRPQSFEQLAGQEFVAATLEKSLETGRIAHAYLFSGPRGCGKTSTARILAKALNCEKGPTSEPCGVCDSCRSITAGSSLDVIEIDGASNTSVENVRQIKDEVLFPPNSSRYKIYIIDEVHMLSTSAFNALLKTIEEPPPYVIFMFATTEQHKVPATIKSRCQQFTFRLVSSDVVVRLLADASADLGVTAEPEALLWIARESGGSVRDAYTLFDQVVSFAEGNITAALIREKLGLVGQDRMNALFGLFVAGDTAGALSALDSILTGGVSPEQFVTDSVEYCRALLLIKNGLTRESILGAPLSSFDLSITEALSGERIERVLSTFLSAYRNLKESIDPRYELDLAVAKASHIGSYVPPSDLVRAVGSLKRYLEKNALAGQPLGVAQAGSQGGAPIGSQTNAPIGLQASAPMSVPASAPAARAEELRAANAGQPQAAAASPVAAPKATPAVVPVAAPTPPSTGGIDPAKLPELKKILVADIRKNNVLLATALDKSHAWRVKGQTLSISVSKQMDCDLLKRFLAIIAEVLAVRVGSPQKIEVALAAEEKADESFGEGDSPFDAPGGDAGLPDAPVGLVSGDGGMDRGAARFPGTRGADAVQGASGLAGNSERESRLPPAFNERAREDRRGNGQGRGEAKANPGRGPAGPAYEPQASLSEREAIGLVERLFKGSLAGYAQATPGLAGPASDREAGNVGQGTARQNPSRDRGSGSRYPAGDSPGLDDSRGMDEDRAATYSPEAYENEVFE
ncbi:MAG TPA: DNA polymerase III subunit gamma/tau [Rectinemataceae bacterium]|nr:DNA polymerase III subunit gamma/tau [Rectinemataceae bacterium]